MTSPLVSVVMTVYFPEGAVGESRARSAEKALASWVQFLRYDHLRLCIADDSPKRQVDLIRPLAQAGLAGWHQRVAHTGQAHRGVGASMNAGFQKGFEESPIVLYAVDDWALTQPLDLAPWVALLLRDESVGCVRLGPPHPDLTGTVKHIPEGWMLDLDRHHFAFATRPALYHARFLRQHGPFLEGVDAYAVEWKYNRDYCERPDGAKVVMALPTIWDHVGEVEVSKVQPAGAHA